MLLAGCNSAPSVVPPPPVAAPPVAAVPTVDPGLRQRRHIEALIAQNDALAARVQELEQRPKLPPVAAVAPAIVPQVAAKPAEPVRIPESEPALLPNADGVLDLAAVRTGDESNPFAVRAIAPDAVREVTLRLDGIVHGPVSCAVVNGRTVQAGDQVETLEVVRVERNALLLRHGTELLRLPLAEKPVRVRLPL